MRKTVRFQEVLIPILRKALPPEVTVGSWVADIDYREYPIVNLRRLGGTRDHDHSRWLDHPVVELTVFSNEGLIEAEQLFHDALDALFEAAQKQTVVDAGYITYVTETMGMTQFSSLFVDSWRVQGLVKVGVRPSPRKD